MYFQIFLLCSLSVNSILGEAPVQEYPRSGPYPPSGWRPRKPFNLPGEYLPPKGFTESEQQRQPQFNVELTKERVDFIGQIESKQQFPTSNQPQKDYLSPNDDSVQIQGLPVEGRYPEFTYQTQQPTNFDQNFQSQDQSFEPHKNYQTPKEQTFFPAAQVKKPSTEYGAPLQQGKDYDLIEARNIQSNDDKAFEAFNTALNDYNRSQDNVQATKYRKDEESTEYDYKENIRSNGPPSSSAKGQYYIVGPDNSIQRVIFSTTQTDEEAKNNGFTAQLKYTSAGTVRDPIYRYNNRGQLIRVVKK